MSLRRSMLRKQFRKNQTLDTLEGLGKLPNTKSATLAMAGNTFSGARRRMAQAQRVAAATAKFEVKLSEPVDMRPAVAVMSRFDTEPMYEGEERAEFAGKGEMARLEAALMAKESGK